MMNIPSEPIFELNLFHVRYGIYQTFLVFENCCRVKGNNQLALQYITSTNEKPIVNYTEKEMFDFVDETYEEVVVMGCKKLIESNPYSVDIL